IKRKARSPQQRLRSRLEPRAPSRRGSPTWWVTPSFGSISLPMPYPTLRRLGASTPPQRNEANCALRLKTRKPCFECKPRTPAVAPFCMMLWSRITSSAPGSRFVNCRRRCHRAREVRSCEVGHALTRDCGHGCRRHCWSRLPPLGPNPTRGTVALHAFRAPALSGGQGLFGSACELECLPREATLGGQR